MSVLEMSLASSVLIAAVLAVRAVLLHRLPRRTLVFLWDIAVLRLLLPLSLPSRLSIFALSRCAAVQPAAFAPGGSDLLTLLTPPAEVPDAAAALSLRTIWAAGAVGCAVFFLWGHLRCLRRYRTALPVTCGPAADCLHAQPLRRRVRLLRSDTVFSPITYGVLRPVILLPNAALSLECETLSYVLAHELWHVRRFDALRRCLFAAALCLHWFNPLVWAFYLFAGRDLETACDEAVVRLFGLSAKAPYARALLQLEQVRSHCAPLCSGFSKTATEERIVSIMKLKKASAPALALALVLVLGVTTVFATSAPTAGAAASPIANGPVLASEPSASSEASPQESMLWPAAEGLSVTQLYGTRVHPVTGAAVQCDHICIGGDQARGSAICAALSGTVTAAGWNGMAGLRIEITHPDGLTTVYAHCSELLVKAGDAVAQGDVIATLGATGAVTGPCLAFGVFQNSQALDPLSCFPEG